MTASIPFVDLQAQLRRLRPAIDAAVARVLEHGHFIMGPEVHELEAALAERVGCRDAVSCGSGTDALLLPLLTWGVGPGDAVFVPAFTFAATAEVVTLLGATPVFVDVTPDVFDIDPERFMEAVEWLGQAHPELAPRAVVPVDLFGHPANYGALTEAADRHGLHVLADAAQSFGGHIDGGSVGTLAPVTATSFFPAKPLGCYGDGGAIFTDDPDLAAALRSRREHGRGVTKYDNVVIGLNGRLDTIQAAILLVKLSVYDDELERRQVIASRYTEALAGRAMTPVTRAGVGSAWAQYTVLVEGRNEVASALAADGIPTAVYYPSPLNRQPAFSAGLTPPAGVEVADALSARVLSLPFHPYLRPQEQDRVISSVLSATATTRH